jgi:hypothetical protein
VDGASILVRWARLERVMERVTTKSGVWRGLSEWQVTLRVCGVNGYRIFRRRLVKVYILFGFYDTQLFLQFSDFGFLPLHSFSRVNLLLHC